ncbi:hypothetical protein SAMD00023353_1202080 [Rosellinia necatrix]|uniref:Uncharacterized protein n=1 Tax=Rosellinia necatrix TaxID=77044 RepID=A0A1S8A6X2_ROSNE|nr:hypothetical protein SAMD00023353_1202080 [Rosellinia necatrix]
MCQGTAVYFIQCGHSSVEWQGCEHRGTDSCRPTRAREAYRDAACGHGWCLCRGDLWNCCGCRGVSKWGECLDCAHVRCWRCPPTLYVGRRVSLAFEDPRETYWRQRYEEQEQASVVESASSC